MLNLRTLFSRWRKQATPKILDELEWTDAHLGPNKRTSNNRDLPDPHVCLQPKLVLDEKVAHRFNAYATAAYPREIGGLLRVVKESPEILRVIDVKIFPHLAATGSYFELDGDAVAQFNMDLMLKGRKDEIPEWCSLIHSHPNMEPFMSGPDKDNLVRLAGEKQAYSVICATRQNPSSNYFDWHYAQGGVNPIVVSGFQVAADNGVDLSGTSTLNSAEISMITDEVQEVFSTVKGGYPGYSGYQSSWKRS